MTERKRIVGAATAGTFVAVWESLPELLPRKRQRWVARWLLLGSLVPVVTISTTASPHKGWDNPKSPADPARLWGEFVQQYPAMATRTGALTSAGLAIAAGVGANRLLDKTVDAGVQAMGRRGVRHPRVLTSVGLGVITAVGTYVQEGRLAATPPLPTA